MNEFLMSIPVWGWIIVLLWEIIWKAIAMWHAARKDQRGWFVALVVVNTVGILPIIYLLRNNKETIEKE